MKIQMVKVVSSNIVSVGHDGKETMHVLYAGKGGREDTLYEFEGVSADAFGKLLNAKSIGSHLYRMNVKGTKVNEEE